MKYLINIIVITILLSCGDSICEKKRIDRKELNWLKYYKEGQIIYFKSDKASVDSFLVYSVINNFTQCNRFELGKNQYEYISVTLEAINEDWKKSKFNKIFIDYSVDNTTDDKKGFCNKGFLLLNLNTNVEIDDLSKNRVDTLYSPSLGKEIICNMFTLGKEAQTESSYKRVKSFYWSEQYGLICYEMFSGEKFIR